MGEPKMSIPEEAQYKSSAAETFRYEFQKNLDENLKSETGHMFLEDKPDNDGTTAAHYELPEGATELKHLIWYKRMNGQVAEAFRSLYRLNDCPHSDTIRNLNKVIAYCEQEKERIAIYGPN